MNPILQFGTSRFLQAHADLFVGEALDSGDALGCITIVQTSDSVESARRVAAFNRSEGFPVRIRGWQDGAAIDVEQRVTSVTEALQANRDWRLILKRVAGEVQVILSNTADQGYKLSDTDNVALLETDEVPVSFPAKLVVLLYARFKHNAAPITLFPCELVTRNGDFLRGLVTTLARQWNLSAGFLTYLEHECIWVNSLVDRIVSESIEPVGAVAEPYALWVIENQQKMTLPCRHPKMIVTDNLERYERLKLFLLNLGHSYLAEQWLLCARPANETVLQAMSDAYLSTQLEAVWEEEVLPVFVALGEESVARSYLTQVRERFLNPFLAHRLSDIAQNHVEKKKRRFEPVLTLANGLGLSIQQARLRTALAGDK
ncbi:D-mannonate oxidoreductase [Collimonas pratensis]|uniref:Mannitol dehydrogenase Rossmann domain protein n=1 Tax=Collimonas pratensis TaxID=279113 RepID=A0A127PYD9_9BURK|nr:D-mannonate oxidoreductase [Collimonas pratensis]AMP02776.1 mannitol dehydrogenase Rossmann domain protein [Collimonas pratensis]